MGHDFIDYGDRHVHLHDMDIWTLRHFFHRIALEATPVSLETDEATLVILRKFFEGWDWLGRGVVSGTNLSDFVQGHCGRASLLCKLFDRTIDCLNDFGEVIPLGYLRQHVNSPMAFFCSEQPIHRFIKAIKRLQEMLNES